MADKDTIDSSVCPVEDEFEFNDRVQSNTTDIMSSLIVPTHDQSIIGQESLTAYSEQQQTSKYDLELGDCGVDRQSASSTKYLELQDSSMGNLSEFLIKKPSQIVDSSIFEIKRNIIDSDKIKMENFEITMSETNEIVLKKDFNSENNSLPTLATNMPANIQAPLSNGTEGSVEIKCSPPVKPVWCDVGVIKSSLPEMSYLVKQYNLASITDEHEHTCLGNFPDYKDAIKVDIQPGQTYRFRVAAVNACGRGEWSEVTLFKTIYSGYPGAPYNIHITSTPDGTCLKWEAPPQNEFDIIEYTVCMAIKNVKVDALINTSPNLRSFNRVYCGPLQTAVISHEFLDEAYIDRTYPEKPAIIFRIAAKNEKGYGPATQVRWLQVKHKKTILKKP